MATEIGRQEMDGRAFVDRENKGECTNNDEDMRTVRKIRMLKDQLIRHFVPISFFFFLGFLLTMINNRRKERYFFKVFVSFCL